MTAPGGEAPAGAELAVGARTLALRNADKVLYPATGFTKRDLVAYYLAVAPAILPHLAGRAVTLARFPDGVDGGGWYQTNCPPGRPPWVGVAEVRGARGQPIRYCRLEEPAALAWAASMAAIELHPLLASADRPAAADALVLDLDPGPGAGLGACARLALRLRALLAGRGLAAFAKVSGARGLHLHVPLDGTQGFERTKGFARTLARQLALEDPGGVTDRMALAERAGKVLVDWRVNAAGRSLVAPWSLRAATVPLVAAPLSWEDVARAAGGDERTVRVGPAAALARLEREGDLLAPALALRQRLPEPPP